MLVSASAQVRLPAKKLLPSLVDICQNHGVEVSDMRCCIDVEYGSCNIEWFVIL